MLGFQEVPFVFLWHPRPCLREVVERGCLSSLLLCSVPLLSFGASLGPGTRPSQFGEPCPPLPDEDEGDGLFFMGFMVPHLSQERES